MIETGGLAILFSWLIFGGLLCILAFVILHGSKPDRGGSSTDAVEKTPKSERTG
jgi:hypothetical protein